MLGMVFAMGEKGERTRERILDVSQQLILQKGYSGTGLDEIVYEAGLTKGGFLYHFKNRDDLAYALMQRYLDEDDRILNDLAAQAQALVDDPYQQLLAFLKLYADLLGSLEGAHPGCLVASYTYESQQFDPRVRELTRQGVQSWKRIFVELLERASASHESQIPHDDLGDMLNALLEGAILLSRIEGSNAILQRQVMLFRDYVRRVFEPRSG